MRIILAVLALALTGCWKSHDEREFQKIKESVMFMQTQDPPDPGYESCMDIEFTDMRGYSFRVCRATPPIKAKTTNAFRGGFQK